MIDRFNAWFDVNNLEAERISSNSDKLELNGKEYNKLCPETETIIRIRIK